MSSPEITRSGNSWSNGDRYGPRVAVGPKLSASRTPSHGTGEAGGRNRFGPNGAAAYGMPRNVATPDSARPRS